MSINYEQMEPDELVRRRLELLLERSRIEEELNRRRAQGRHITRSSDLKWRNIGQAMGTDPDRWTTRIAPAIAPELGFDIHNLHCFFEEVPPGCQVGAYHMHGEAIKYYIQGRGVEIIGDKRYEVQAGDLIFIPAFTWHGTQNPGTEPLHFLAVTQYETPICHQQIFKVRQDLRV